MIAVKAQQSLPSLKIVTKNKELAQHFKRILKANGYGLDWCRSYSSLPKRLDNAPVKAVFIDAEIVKELGSRIYEELNRASSSAAIILVYSEADQNMVREAMHSGVYGCIRAPYRDWEITKIASYLAARPSVPDPLAINQD